ncbi:MAG TPA: dihydrodipicolinate synthase family protein, partial [Candidatus Methylacidiphilales bacterium]
LISRACRQVNGRIPVLVGITDTSCVEALRVAEWAAEAGAQAVVLSAPYYFPAGQPELLEYLQRLAPRLPLPVFLYNMPAMTKVVFEPETVRRALEIPQVAGLKDSSGNPEYFRQVREITRARKDWSLLVGPEHMLAQTMEWGGDGGVCGGANVLPRLFVDLFEACEAKDALRRDELQKAVADLGRLYTIGSHSSAIIKGIKCALSILGICRDGMAEPFSPFAEPERSRIREIVESLGVSTLPS